MNREILISPIAAPVGPAPATAPTSPAAATAPLPAPIKDALAGALPAWDLLPAAPFVRRIK